MMKRLIPLWLWAVCSSAISAQDFSDPAIISQTAIEPSGTAPSYLLSENFDGAGIPSGWTTNGPAAVDFDYTSVVLEGSQSVRFVGSGTLPNATSPSFGEFGECWGYFLWRPVSAGAFNRDIFRLYDGTSPLLLIRRQSTGTMRVAHGTATAATVGTTSNGTTYHFWWYYKKGTGSNGEAWIGFSTDGVRPTSGDDFVSLSNGSLQFDGDNVGLGWFTSNSEECIFDKVRVDDETIGNSPQ